MTYVLTFIIGMCIVPGSFYVVGRLARRMGFTTRTLTIYGEKFVPIEKGAKVYGHFAMVGGQLHFTCIEENATYSEVHAAITDIRDHCQKQLDTQGKCPFNHLKTVTEKG